MFHCGTLVSFTASAWDSNSFILFPYKSYCMIRVLFLHHFFHKVRYECFSFSLRETHSRFSTQLLYLSQSIWFTSGLFSIFGIKAKATSRWDEMCFITPFLVNPNLLYFHKDGLSIFLYLNKDFTFHNELTWYNHSYQGMSFQISVSIK